MVVRHLLTVITISAECVLWSQSTVLMFNVMSLSILVCTDCQCTDCDCVKCSEAFLIHTHNRLMALCLGLPR